MKIIKLTSLPTESVSHDPTILKKVIAKKGEIPHITQIAQAILKSGDIVEAHAHTDLYEVFFLESGELTATINGTEIMLAPGNVITIEPNDTHRFQNLSNSPVTLFYFGVEA